MTRLWAKYAKKGSSVVTKGVAVGIHLDENPPKVEPSSIDNVSSVLAKVMAIGVSYSAAADPKSVKSATPGPYPSCEKAHLNTSQL
jgi:hypothetical protein